MRVWKGPCQIWALRGKSHWQKWLRGAETEMLILAENSGADCSGYLMCSSGFFRVVGWCVLFQKSWIWSSCANALRNVLRSEISFTHYFLNPPRRNLSNFSLQSLSNFTLLYPSSNSPLAFLWNEWLAVHQQKMKQASSITVLSFLIYIHWHLHIYSLFLASRGKLFMHSSLSRVSQSIKHRRTGGRQEEGLSPHLWVLISVRWC